MASKYDNLVNTVHTNTYGDRYIITKVDNSSCIYVKFLDEYHYETHTNYGNIAKGRVKNIFGKHVCGVGYIGNATTKNVNDNNTTRKAAAKESCENVKSGFVDK